MSMIMEWHPVKAGDLAAVLAMDGEALMEWMEDGDGTVVDVDKAWQGIHAVLTGTAGPQGHELDALVFGGTPFGEDEFGYGPARHLRAAEVARLAGLVEAIEVADFEARIDLGTLAALDVYPGIWDRPDEAASNVTYLCDGYASLRDAFLSARTNDEAMIVALV